MRKLIYIARSLYIIVVIDGIVYGIVYGICSYIRDQYRHSPYLVTAKDDLELTWAPILFAVVVLIFLIWIYFFDKDNPSNKWK